MAGYCLDTLSVSNGSREILERRKKLGVSREKAAARLGISSKTLERKERGMSPLSELERVQFLALYDRLLAEAQEGRAA